MELFIHRCTLERFHRRERPEWFYYNWALWGGYPPAYKGGPSVPGYKGDPLDLESWDGSDIFILEHTCYKYVTEKVQKTLSKLTYSNVAFVDIAERLIPQKDAIWEAPMGVKVVE